ncbi:hypothetical protein CLLU_27460 [Clostridium luticellarii]|uniref:Uncharacterized protein n=1 Tax=Clostridium luticellarii TaxID=1691940 RepID=A0A2T0BGN8_9CLOT|nr:hypothetical protein CLLU_27460 [Clostridium luticellarii]
MNLFFYMIARNKWAKPETDRESFEILAERDIIERKYIESWKR